MAVRALHFLLVAAFSVQYSASQDLKIEPSERELILSEGVEQKLTCTARHSSPNNVVSWTFPSAVPQVNVKRSNPVEGRKNADGTYTTVAELLLSSISKENTGGYTCTLFGDGNKIDSTLNIHVLEVSKSDNPIYYFGNKTVTLSCKFVGETAEFVEWLAKNETVEDGEKYQIDKTSKALTIKKLDRDDAGVYTARYKLTPSNNIVECIVEYTAGPLVLDMDKSINRVEEETVEIECDVKGFPSPDVTWLRGDKPFEEVKRKDMDFHYEKYKGVDNAKLVIENLKFDDKGVYTCKAYSERFNETSKKSIKLRVKDKLAWLWPFLGIIAEVIVLILLILLFEKIKKKNDSAPPRPHEE